MERVVDGLRVGTGVYKGGEIWEGWQRLRTRIIAW